MLMGSSRQDEFGNRGFPDGKNPFRDFDDAVPAQNSSPFARQEPFPPGPGKVHHVRTIALLMIVQGVLQIVLGLILMAFGASMPFLMEMVKRRRPDPVAEMPPVDMSWFVTAFYVGLSFMLLVSAGMLILAGVQNYQFRNRVFGIVAMSSCVVTLLSCYCVPTATGLIIYGLVVYLDPRVVAAFASSASVTARQEDIGPVSS